MEIVNFVCIFVIAEYFQACNLLKLKYSYSQNKHHHIDGDKTKSLSR